MSGGLPPATQYQMDADDARSRFEALQAQLMSESSTEENIAKNFARYVDTEAVWGGTRW